VEILGLCGKLGMVEQTSMYYCHDGVQSIDLLWTCYVYGHGITNTNDRVWILGSQQICFKKWRLHKLVYCSGAHWYDFDTTKIIESFVLLSYVKQQLMVHFNEGEPLR
jgi:hypothetical protein